MISNHYLKQEGLRVIRSLGQRVIHLFLSRIHGEGEMDDAARRRRAITCSHAVLELFKAFPSVTVTRLTIGLPNSIGHILQHLSRDPKITLGALRTVAVMERTLQDLLGYWGQKGPGQGRGGGGSACRDHPREWPCFPVLQGMTTQRHKKGQ